MTDAFSRCHPILNFFYFAVVLGFTMFVQHPVYLAVSDDSKSADRGAAESYVQSLWSNAASVY